MKNIALVGDSWGFISALNGLIKVFTSIEVITNEKLKSNANVVYKHKLEDLESDIIIFAGYNSIVNKKILKNKKCLNIHYSLLPKYRGLHSTVWAIINEEEYLGYTVHEMNQFIDDGDIIYQKKFENDNISSATSYINLFNIEIESILGELVLNYIHGKIKPIQQNKKHASWVGKRNLEDCRIDFSATINEIMLLFRVLQHPYPLPFFSYKGSVFNVKKLKSLKNNTKSHTSRILNIDNEGVWVKVQDGYVILKTIINSKGENLKAKEILKIGNYLNND